MEEEILNNEVVEDKPTPQKKLKLKKNWRTNFVSPTGFKISEIYCRRCVQYKNPKDFQTSQDSTLDKNGMLSICRSCCEEIYQDNLRAEKDIARALLKTCRTLNWVFYSPAIEATIEKYKNTKERNPDGKSSFTTAYWGVINGTNNMKYSEIPIMTFTEPIKEDFIPTELLEKEVDSSIIDFWGKGFSFDEYEELQKNYLDFKRDYTVEVQGEVFLVQQICYKILELNKTRTGGGSTDGLLKEIQTIMKNSALTPAMANMANSGKAMDTFGMRIATIQKEEPAEWLDGEDRRKKYLNYGDLQYFKDYYVRSLKNFILQSKDWNIEGEILKNEDEDDDLEIENFVMEDADDIESKEES
jgi:hypothetical protein